MSVETCLSKLQFLLTGYPANRFFFLLDSNGYYLDLKVPDESRLWLKPEEHIGKHLKEVLPPDLSGDRIYHFNKAIESGKPEIWSYPHPRREGWMTCELHPIADDQGKIVEVFMQVYDIADPTEIPACFKLEISENYPL